MAVRSSAEQIIASPTLSLKGRPLSADWSTMAKDEMGMLTTRDEETAPGDERDGRRKFQEQTSCSASAGNVESSEKPPATTLRIGQEVLVSGLKAAAQYNGTVGRIQGVRGDGRCEVLLLETAGDGGEPKTLALKPDTRGSRLKRFYLL
eukprot:3411310-Amphidinium_carterae.1